MSSAYFDNFIICFIYQYDSKVFTIFFTFDARRLLKKNKNKYRHDR